MGWAGASTKSRCAGMEPQRNDADYNCDDDGDDGDGDGDDDDDSSFRRQLFQNPPLSLISRDVC